MGGRLGISFVAGFVSVVLPCVLPLVPGYLAALYLFLNRAPVGLRLVAFVLLSIGLVFLGGSAAVVQTMQNGLFAAWEKIPSPAFSLQQVRNPLPVALSDVLPFTQQQLGVGIGWSVACSVYVVLAYLTFLYRWPQEQS